MQHLPEAFKTQLQQQLGEEMDEFAEALQKSSPVSIRINPKKTSESPSQQGVSWSQYGYYLQHRPVFTLDPLFHAGQYYVQEASSMFLEYAIKKSVNLELPLRVLDLSAAPGGKSTHLLSLLNSESFLVSNEVIRSRASVLSENIQKWGYANCLVTNNDPSDFSSLTGYFDVIVVDAPCSGEGLFRKDPGAINEWSPDNVALCASRQQRILQDVWPALKENGILIYSTCTYNRTENEDNLTQFKKDHDITFVDLSPPAEWQIVTVEKEGVIGYRFFPHKVQGEGFFISVIRKNESSGIFRQKQKPRLQHPSRKFSEAIMPWISNDAYELYQHNELIFSISKSGVNVLESLLPQVRFVYTGTNVATAKHDKLIPEHALALSTSVNQNSFICVDLDLDTAIKYLRKDTISIEDTAKGFGLMRYEGQPLGWANLLQNRVNNLYPSEWRIRMEASAKK
jgi:16S rRNA C967 or C1407 C5-methylase (RsmB/RsmF family)/NOL1/NOP2/fmu family ribosome biogenesis protein